MQKISPQTKSFIFLLSFAIIGTFVCVNLYSGLQKNAEEYNYNINGNEAVKYPEPKNSLNPLNIQTAEALETIEPASTENWQIFRSEKYNLSFKYPAEWQVKEGKSKNGFNVLEIDPGLKYYNIKIYIHASEFYALDGLPYTKETIAGFTALNVTDSLYGIKSGSYFYTFDVGLSMSLRPQFKALVLSASFN